MKDLRADESHQGATRVSKLSGVDVHAIQDVQEGIELVLLDILEDDGIFGVRVSGEIFLRERHGVKLEQEAMEEVCGSFDLAKAMVIRDGSGVKET